MSDNTKIQASIIVALFGFFIGGIVNINKEIIEIFLSAIIGGIIIFFIVFFILNIYYKKSDKPVEYNHDKDKDKGKGKGKGKKIDIIINDTDDLINNYLNK